MHGRPAFTGKLEPHKPYIVLADLLKTATCINHRGQHGKVRAAVKAPPQQETQGRASFTISDNVLREISELLLPFAMP